MAALLAQLVGHVQQHQRRNTQRDHACRQHQVGVQIRRVENHDDRIRTRRSRHLPGQNIDGHLFVFGLRRQAVDAGEIDQRDLFPVGVAQVAGVMFDGNAGKVADFLAQLGEAVKQRGLAGIGRTDNCNGAIRGA
jgi:hypothetical protein